MKKILFVVFSLALCLCLSLGASAVEYGEIEDEYEEMLGGIPEDIAPLLPDGIFSEDITEIGGSVDEMTDFGYILRYVGELVGLNFSSALKMFASLCGILMLSAVFSTFKSAFRSEALSKAYSFCTSAVIALSIVALQYSLISSLSLFFGRLKILVGSMLPIMGVLYALGGNVASAVTSNAALLSFMTLIELLCGSGLIYMVKLCTASALAGSFSGGVSLSGVTNLIKKTYTLSLGFLMLIFTTVLSMQSSLAARSDSLGAKATKFVVSSSIPLVGGSVGETLRTVGASVDYLKGYLGIFGILLIIIMLLPTLISVLLNRLSLMAAASVADLIGCESEKRLLTEITSIYGYVAAIVALSSVVFIFALTLFVRTTAAIGG